ncbi:MAG: phosphoribosyltransferase family protein, partial [Victivallales bacterium]|nr:phosphoribosyltransferase family protein [Victivallales bacterium]
RSRLKLPLAGRHVLVTDEILDTGNTLVKIRAMLAEQSPLSLKFCVLLDKPERREAAINGDYVGFTIPNRFVVGYGLDFDEYYRNLPYVGVIPDH